MGTSTSVDVYIYRDDECTRMPRLDIRLVQYLHLECGFSLSYEAPANSELICPFDEEALPIR